MNKYLQRTLYLILVIYFFTSLPTHAQQGTEFSLFLPITQRGDQASSSNELIDQALASKQITLDTAALYKTYIAFDDKRLPSAYQGKDNDELEKDTLYEVMSLYPQLSASTKAEIDQLLLPPNSDTAPKTTTMLVSTKWQKITQDDSPFVVWYQEHHASTDRPKAQTLFQELNNTIWPLLTELMGDPASDESIKQNGGDQRFDIYLVDNSTKAVPYLGCQNSPAYMLANRNNPDKNRISVALMHAILYGYGISSCENYAWLRDATGVWAAEYTYPAAQFEHQFVPYYSTEAISSLKPNGKRGFNRNIFLFALTELLASPSKVPELWSQAKQPKDVLEVINTILPGGFSESWPEIGVANWNRSPNTPYRQIDDITVGAKANANYTIDLKSTHTNTTNIRLPKDHLSHYYYHFQFSGEAVRSIVIDNLNYQDIDEDITIQILARLVGQQTWEDPIDISEEVGKFYCRDFKSERIAEFVIVASNSFYDLLTPLTNTDLRVTSSNVACRGWEGLVTYDYDYGDMTLIEKGTVTTQARFTRNPAMPYELDEDQTIEIAYSLPDNSTSHITHEETYPHPDDGNHSLCTMRINQNVPINTNKALQLNIAKRSYDIEGELKVVTIRYTDSCGLEDQTTPPGHYWWTLSGAPELLAHVSDDGKTIQASYKGYGFTYEWDLTALPPE
jgi:hypothetical protein